MSNRRESLPDPADSESSGSSPRCGNPSSAFDDGVTDVVEAATTRASTVNHRFGGVQYALRRDPGTDAIGPDIDGGPDPVDGSAGTEDHGDDG